MNTQQKIIYKQHKQTKLNQKYITQTPTQINTQTQQYKTNQTK